MVCVTLVVNNCCRKYKKPRSCSIFQSFFSTSNLGHDGTRSFQLSWGRRIDKYVPLQPIKFNISSMPHYDITDVLCLKFSLYPHPLWINLQFFKAALWAKCVQGYHTDVVFHLDDGKASAHRAILMARSDVMRAMFSGDFRERRSQCVCDIRTY